MLNKVYFPLLKSLFLLCITTYSFAATTNIINDYRLHGIQGLEKTLDKKLTDSDYWEKYLKNKDTQFGYIELYTNILLCDKSKSELLIYSRDANNTYHLRKEYSAFTGKLKGDKRKEGDLRTPVGVYNIVKKISKVDSFYGPMAFVTSYPNLYDRYKGKTGQGIWIHGLPTNQERDAFTKGCIAIKNKSIECMNRDINIKKTLLIIKENDKHQTAISKDKLSILLSQLYAWRYAWLYNDIDTYLNFYTPKFRRFDGMNLQRFKQYKTRVFAKNEHKTILFHDINVIPYPNKKDVYKITFKEIYKSNTFSFIGDKTLIVTLLNNKFNIITEQ